MQKNGLDTGLYLKWRSSTQGLRAKKNGTKHVSNLVQWLRMATSSGGGGKTVASSCHLAVATKRLQELANSNCVIFEFQCQLFFLESTAVADERIFNEQLLLC